MGGSIQGRTLYKGGHYSRKYGMYNLGKYRNCIFCHILSNFVNFSVKTVRSNPADPGAVTGSATYNSFLSSIMRAGGKGQGIHLC